MSKGSYNGIGIDPTNATYHPFIIAEDNIHSRVGDETEQLESQGQQPKVMTKKVVLDMTKSSPAAINTWMKAPTWLPQYQHLGFGSDYGCVCLI